MWVWNLMNLHSCSSKIDCTSKFSIPKLSENIDKNHTGIDDRCVSSWFCSHPVGPYPRDQERTTDPYQDRPSLHLTIAQWHHSPSSSSYLIKDGSHLQQNQATSPLKSHIIIKSYLRGPQWDFCWNPQETNQDLGFKISFEPKLVHL